MKKQRMTKKAQITNMLLVFFAFVMAISAAYLWTPKVDDSFKYARGKIIDISHDKMYSHNYESHYKKSGRYSKQNNIFLL